MSGRYTDKSRITFTVGTTVHTIGYYEWIHTDYEGNPLGRIIPRAKGIQTYSGEEMGGGQYNIEIHAFVLKDSRLEVEQFVKSLIDNIANQKGTLTIDGTLTYYNCCLTGITTDAESKTWNYFTLKFFASI